MEETQSAVSELGMRSLGCNCHLWTQTKRGTVGGKVDLKSSPHSTIQIVAFADIQPQLS